MEYYLTEERLGELKTELEHLKSKARLEVAERLKRAKELGDLSENAEYAEAREEQNRVESRIEELEQIIKNSVIIKRESAKKAAAVDIGSTVEVAKEGKQFRFFIGGRSETKPEAGFISNESPLGNGLLGHKVGDSIVVKTPTGEARYKITKIE